MMDSRVLLVEGQDDRHVLWALFEAHKVPDTFQVEKAGGIEQLLESVPVRLKASDLERFGVVLDADEDIQARWQQLRSRLIASGCGDVPEKPSPLGLVLQMKEGPKVGAWLMPDNTVPGMLENFLAFLIPPSDKLLPLVDRFLDAIPLEDRRCPNVRLPKARLHAWLAVQEHPGKPLGQAITAKYLDAQHSVVAPFLAWIKAMFLD
jgi:hypothetical protein